ncbi:potassium channel family protein [Georgenia sp. H159]|uniref:potassium channel family protein n=1 Tax=Georgenia sp. H159 TaxID=3076115 RepID=UPI002D7A2FC1|nr:potassium channel family protein [Georgenia sp. H159]
MTWAMSVLGGVLVVTALWDVFHTLWHPSGQGPVGKLVMRLVWRLSRHLGKRGRRLSGPSTMVLVIVTWAGMIIVGWALIYWPHMPDGFSFSPGLAPEQRNDALDALYLSLVAIATLGLGDIAPTEPGLRILVPLEALLGFALLTAAVSWVLQVYPALTRRRALALRLDGLRRVGTTDVLLGMSPATAARLLDGVTDAVGAVYVDLLQYSESYYFRDANDRTTLAMTAPYARELAGTAAGSDSEDLRHAGRALSAVLDDLATVLDDQFLHTGADTEAVLDAYREDQRLP